MKTAEAQAKINVLLSEISEKETALAEAKDQLGLIGPAITSAKLKLTGLEKSLVALEERERDEVAAEWDRLKEGTKSTAIMDNIDTMKSHGITRLEETISKARKSVNILDKRQQEARATIHVLEKELRALNQDVKVYHGVVALREFLKSHRKVQEAFQALCDASRELTATPDYSKRSNELLKRKDVLSLYQFIFSSVLGPARLTSASPLNLGDILEHLSTANFTGNPLYGETSWRPTPKGYGQVTTDRTQYGVVREYYGNDNY